MLSGGIVLIQSEQGRAQIIMSGGIILERAVDISVNQGRTCGIVTFVEKCHCLLEAILLCRRTG